MGDYESLKSFIDDRSLPITTLSSSSQLKTIPQLDGHVYLSLSEENVSMASAEFISVIISSRGN